MAVLNNMSESHAELLKQQPGGCAMPLVVWDTYSKVLAVSSRSIWAEPDVLLCDRFAANVVSVIEVTRKQTGSCWTSKELFRSLSGSPSSGRTSAPVSHGGQGSSAQTM